MKRSYIVTAAILSTLIISCGKSDNNENAAATSIDEDIALVDVAIASAQDVEQIRSYTANVEAFNVNNISPNTINRIKSITVDVGDHVHRGQVVATMDNATAAQLKVNLDQLEREYNRAVQLLKIGSGTQAAVDQIKAQLDAARTQYNSVMENVVLTSPVSGVVTARNYDPGDMSGQLPIVTVGQISPNVKVLIDITETDRSLVAVGNTVTVSLDALPDQTFDGRISRIYPAVDPSTRTFRAEVIIPNNGGKIFPGMFARVTLSRGTLQNIVIPDMAIVKQTGSGNKYVYILRSGIVKFVPVQLGQRFDNKYEIIDGIADGDTVVITGQARLADGVPVKVRHK